MKKAFFTFMAICAIVFCGCEKDENGGGNGSIIIDGVKLVGTWACTADYFLLYWPEGPFDDNESAYKSFIKWADASWKDGDMIDYLLVINDDYSMEYYYAPNDGFVFKGGYLYNCSFNDFKTDHKIKFKIENGKLYISDVLRGFKAINNDTIIIDETPWDPSPYRYQRVKGYK